MTNPNFYQNPSHKNNFYNKDLIEKIAKDNGLPNIQIADGIDVGSNNLYRTNNRVIGGEKNNSLKDLYENFKSSDSKESNIILLLRANFIAVNLRKESKYTLKNLEEIEIIKALTEKFDNNSEEKSIKNKFKNSQSVSLSKEEYEKLTKLLNEEVKMNSKELENIKKKFKEEDNITITLANSSENTLRYTLNQDSATVGIIQALSDDLKNTDPKTYKLIKDKFKDGKSVSLRKEEYESIINALKTLGIDETEMINKEFIKEDKLLQKIREESSKIDPNLQTKEFESLKTNNIHEGLSHSIYNLKNIQDNKRKADYTKEDINNMNQKIDKESKKTVAITNLAENLIANNSEQKLLKTDEVTELTRILVTKNNKNRIQELETKELMESKDLKTHIGDLSNLIVNDHASCNITTLGNKRVITLCHNGFYNNIYQKKNNKGNWDNIFCDISGSLEKKLLESDLDLKTINYNQKNPSNFGAINHNDSCGAGSGVIATKYLLGETELRNSDKSIQKYIENPDKETADNLRKFIEKNKTENVADKSVSVNQR